MRPYSVVLTVQKKLRIWRVVLAKSVPDICKRIPRNEKLKNDWPGITFWGNIKWLAEQCGTSVAMIEEDYERYIRDDGDAPLRALARSEPETLGGQAPQ